MKTLIIHFSQTGNTRKIAECIYDGIIETKSECDMIALNDVKPTLLSDYELIGIGSPVFYYKEPFNVQNFIEALPEQGGRHWFVFCTHGNIIGDFFPSVTKKLIKKGATVIGFHNTYANITVPYYPMPSYTSGHPDSYDFENAKTFGRKIVEHSLKNNHNDKDFIPKPGPVSSAEWIEESKMLTIEAIKQFMPKFSINTETCIQCHECEENCPVQGIDIGAEPPHIQDPCIYCWRCVTICPTLSVEADWKPLVAMAPTNYARYKKELDKVAARGEFRWLIDPETIVFDDPLYKQRQHEIKSKG